MHTSEIMERRLLGGTTDEEVVRALIAAGDSPTEAIARLKVQDALLTPDTVEVTEDSGKGAAAE